MAGRVVRAEVIDRIDEAPAQEVGPHPVDERLGQALVLGVGDQLAQLGPADDIRPLADLAAVEEPRERRFRPCPLRRSNRDVTRRSARRSSSVWSYASRPVASACGHVLGLHPLEERVDPPEIDLLPVVRRVVVALGALDLLAEEQPGRARGQRDGVELEVGQDVIDRPVFLVRAGRP